METFDEWYKRKHGYTFDEEYMQPSLMIVDAMKALSVEMRKYVSEFVRGANAPENKVRDSHAWCDYCKSPPAAPCYDWCKLIATVPHDQAPTRKTD